MKRRFARGLLVATAALVGLALAMVVTTAVTLLVLGRLPQSDGERELVLAGALGIAVTVALTAWLGPRVGRFVMPGVRRSPDAVLHTLGDRASRGVPMEELLLQLAESLRRVLDLRSVEIWTGDDSRLDRLLSVPSETLPTVTIHGAAVGRVARTTVAGDGWLRLWLPELLEGRGSQHVRIVPALHAGSVLGLVVVTREAGRERFHDADERTLLEVGRRLGVLLHNRALDSALQATLDDLRRTNDELRASRARLAAASDDARRRIERDLHDGAQQHLVAIAVNLGLAGDLVDEDPAAAKELVEQTRLEARAAVTNLRDLAHGIYPPQLIRSGIGEALRSLAAGPTGAGPVRRVEVDGVGRHEPPVEAAVYFCCLEAVQNAAKHAPGSSVEILATSGERELVVEVVDHGPGMPDPITLDGQGLQNMIDRVGAVGGTVTWEPGQDGGTRVRVVVPTGEPVGAQEV